MDKKQLKQKEKPKIQFEDNLINKAKKISVNEAKAYAVMDGFGLNYVTPYALAVGANNKIIGLLSSIPSLLGNLSQLYTLHAMKKWSRKKITFIGVFLQAIMWLMLIAIGTIFFVFNIKTQLTPYLIVAVYTILILVGAFSGPAWTSWMKDLIKKNRGDYFSRRSRIAGTISLICMLIAGFILDYFKNTKLFIGFAIIFFIAFIGRTTSAFLMLKQYEPKFKTEDKSYFTIFEFIKKMIYNNFGRFVLFFSLFSLAVMIGSPFLAVLMLKELNFTYVQYMVAILSASLATIIAIPLWGKFADKYGNIRVMKMTGLSVSILPVLWMLAIPLSKYDSSLVLLYLVIEQCLSGAMWAGFNLAAGNFIYDAVTRERIAICASYFSIINGFGIVIGATIGGYFASLSNNLMGLTPILFVFLLSGIARLGIYFIMRNRIKEVREVEHFEFNLKKETENILSSMSLKKFGESFQSKDSP